MRLSRDKFKDSYDHYRRLVGLNRVHALYRALKYEIFGWDIDAREWVDPDKCICQPMLDGGTLPRPRGLPLPLMYDPNCPVHNCGKIEDE